MRAARVVLADQWVRYSVVPWSDALSSTGERLAHARELMSGVFGDRNERLDRVPVRGAARRVAAWPARCRRHCCRRSRMRRCATARSWSSVQPQLIAAYNTWRHVLPAARPPPGSSPSRRARSRRCACARDGIDRVHAVRIGARLGARTEAAADLRPAGQCEPDRRTRVRRSAGRLAHAAPGGVGGSGVARRAESAADHSASARAPAQKGGMRQRHSTGFRRRAPRAVAGGRIAAGGGRRGGRRRVAGISHHRAASRRPRTEAGRVGPRRCAGGRSGRNARGCADRRERAAGGDGSRDALDVVACRNSNRRARTSQGQVALLGVEPDHAKHNVRVSAEARTLKLALAYVERLQASRSLELSHARPA